MPDNTEKIAEFVTNKHLGQALAHIQKIQLERDRDLLASKRLTNREKWRLRETTALSDL